MVQVALQGTTRVIKLHLLRMAKTPMNALSNLCAWAPICFRMALSSVSRALPTPFTLPRTAAAAPPPHLVSDGDWRPPSPHPPHPPPSHLERVSPRTLTRPIIVPKTLKINSLWAKIYNLGFSLLPTEKKHALICLTIEYG